MISTSKGGSASAGSSAAGNPDAGEFRSADAVVAVDVFVGHSPALARRVGAGVVDLAGDRLVLVTTPG